MTSPAEELGIEMAGTSDDTAVEDCDSDNKESADATPKCQTNADGEGTSDAARKMEMKRLLNEQTEYTRSWLVEAAESPDIDELSQGFARTTAAIIQYWQNYARGEDPTAHQIHFDIGLKINLLSVLAILPERYQHAIQIEDKSRSPANDGDAMSWLHEDTMNLLVGLFTRQEPFSFLGQGIASMVTDDIDNSWREWYEMSYLEHQIDQLSKNELSEQEMRVYLYPLWTEKIVFFFNPTGIHWTLVEIDLSEDYWTYSLYNSLSQGRKGATWKACKEQLPLLERLICCVSGFPEPEFREFLVETSAQQHNHYDCGPITVYNAIKLLQGRMPSQVVDAEQLRLCYLNKILSSLQISVRSDSVYWELTGLQTSSNLDLVYWGSTVN